VRTLRELGADLPAIRKVVHRELPLPAVAAAHAGTLDVQIRILRLRLRRAVLTAVARRGSTPKRWISCTSWPGYPRTNANALSATSPTPFGDLVTEPSLAGIRGSLTP
jgi:hypothetical protein